jgi:hypothetical protein|uniref:PilZ domain-containing protein n=1 Tax=uncultured Sphingomonas sp. TaxID=158754 RepID=UPI0035C9702C
MKAKTGVRAIDGKRPGREASITVFKLGRGKPAIVQQPNLSAGSVAQSDGDALPGIREARESVLLAAEVGRFGNSAATLHRIRNLSPNGARIDKAAALRPGETILITVGSLAAIGATVRWVAQDNAGIRFFETIDLVAARSKTIMKTAAASPTLAPTKPTPERDAQLAGWLAALESAYG